MRRIWSCDPGLNICSVGVYQDQKLVAARMSRLPAKQRFRLHEACEYHARAMVGLPSPTHFALEEMSLNKGWDKTHTEAIAKGNDLLAVQAVGAYLAGWFGGQLLYTEPQGWKGTASKEWTEQRCLEWLDSSELAVVESELASHRAKSLHHNLWDAVAIGLWATSRLVVRLPPRWRT